MKKTEVISEGKNEIIEWWSDTLSIENNKIIYLEHMFLKDGLETENWIEFKDDYNDEMLIPLLSNFLKNQKNDRISKLITLLKKLNIRYKHHNWETFYK